MKIKRANGRRTTELRKLEIVRGYTKFSPGSVLIRMGDTAVLCTASVEEAVPEWLTDQGQGWVTAEYDMLPGSTGQRRKRNKIKPDGRSTEIQRLIGRTLRAVTDLEALGERSIWLDCDVIQADGGTRTAAINGAFIALSDAVRWMKQRKIIKKSPIIEAVAAVSVGKVDGRILLDLDYAEDSNAQVDFNIAMTASGKFVELQGSAEGGTFTQAEFQRMLTAAKKGIKNLINIQKRVLAKRIKK
ncbi:MAG: ribonuclease PH [Planctomycetota bacterium]